MDKQAYFKLMGLQKSAADKPVIAPKGTDTSLKPSAKPNFNYKTPTQFASEINNGPGAADQFGKLVRTFGERFNTPGKLSFWEELWETIKSWFGSDSAKKALTKSNEVVKGQKDAANALNTFAQGKLKKLTDPNAKALQELNLSDVADRAVKRRARAQALTTDLAPEKQRAAQDYLVGRGEQNLGELYAPKGELTAPKGLSPEETKKII